MRPCLAIPAVAAVLASVPAGAAPRSEHWVATSTTAMAITGDIDLSPTRLSAAGKVIPLKVAADVPAFGTPMGPRPARIMRVLGTGNPRLLRGNTICQPAPRWLALYRGDRGRRLNVAAFTGDAQPAGEGAPGLCATYLYTR